METLAEDASGRERKPWLTPEQVAAGVNPTLQKTAKDPTHRGTRSMAHAHGLSHAGVQRTWEVHDLQPRRTKTFKGSTDKQFVDKLREVVGSRLDPPHRPLVLCVSEKTTIQVGQRNQLALTELTSPLRLADDTTS